MGPPARSIRPFFALSGGIRTCQVVWWRWLVWRKMGERISGGLSVPSSYRATTSTDPPRRGTNGRGGMERGDRSPRPQVGETLDRTTDRLPARLQRDDSIRVDGRIQVIRRALCRNLKRKGCVNEGDTDSAGWRPGRYNRSGDRWVAWLPERYPPSSSRSAPMMPMRPSLGSKHAKNSSLRVETTLFIDGHL